MEAGTDLFSISVVSVGRRFTEAEEESLELPRTPVSLQGNLRTIR